MGGAVVVDTKRMVVGETDGLMDDVVGMDTGEGGSDGEDDGANAGGGDDTS